MLPDHLVHPGVGFNGTLKVHIVTLLDVAQVERATDVQGGFRDICGRREEGNVVKKGGRNL